jgi:diketogulonate reductase-like aldo/keto reductase
MNSYYAFSRRRFLQALAIAGLGFGGTRFSLAKQGSILTKPVPSSQEQIPVIGLGSSRTFNVGNDPEALDNVTEVIRHFFSAGGTLIDSSPMYGSSQPAIGYALNKLQSTNKVFSADKVWTWDTEAGIAQMEQSRKYWQVDAFALMQVHNLVEWQYHLQTLYEMKNNGSLRYVGITTSHGRRHHDFEHVMETETLDFVQLSYNIVDREVEQTLLPLAQERGIAVIVNRPFQRGDLIEQLQGKPLPKWSKKIGCQTWPQFLLKFVISHPAVTCAIPATSQVAHVKENMLAAYGVLPEPSMRQQMIDYVEKMI